MSSISESVLLKEKENGEKRLARARLYLMIAIFIATLLPLLFRSVDLDVQLLMSLMASGAVAYALIWLIYINQTAYRPYLRYLSSGMDLVYVILLNLSWELFQDFPDYTGQLRHAIGFGSLITLIILTGIRFDYKTVFWITILSVLFYVFYIYYAHTLGTIKFTASWKETRFNLRSLNIIELFSRVMIILLAGSLMTYVINRAGRLLQMSVETTIQKEQLRQFISANVVEEIEAGRARLDLSGQRQVIAIMFCDIRDFTLMSKKLSPEELLTMLNRYYEFMAEEIFKHNGTLDKYIGDGIMALFGAPMELKNPSYTAVQCATAMLARLEPFNKKYGYNIRIGIGIHTDSVVVGNLGTETYKNYTAIGEGVNIASRIEGATKDSRYDLLFSESVCIQVKDRIKPRSAGHFKLKGIGKGLELFTKD